MGYLHIDNLHKNQSILLFKECYALEKIHGTSAHVSWKFQTKEVRFFTGGNHINFIKLFNQDTLKSKFLEFFPDIDVTIYGEAYGGKQQGMSKTYGPDLKFIAFDVKVGDFWISVPNALDVSSKIGIEFVDFTKCSTNIEDLDREMNKDSTQAIRNGVGFGKIREGVVLRPLVEVTLNNGDRIIAKHKRPEFRETKTERKVVDPSRLEVLVKADEIAEEWVVPMRLDHVIDKMGGYENISMSDIREIIKSMIEDVYREAKGEIIESKEVDRSIGTKTANMIKKKLEVIS